MGTTDRFVINDDDRYARLRLIGWWDQQKLNSAKVLVVGAGALGNEVLKNLALLGIGKIYLIDFDTIQNSNLSRSILFRAHDAGKRKVDVAANAVNDLNPDCCVHPIHGDVLAEVGLGLVRDVDVVIGCLDNREARLWLNRMCWKVATPWIDGGIQEINGVAKVFMPPDGPCYECGMTERDYQLIQLRYSCPLLKQEDLLQGKVPTAPTIASIIGGLQVQEALKLIHAMESETGTALVFNGVANNFYKSKFTVKEGCLSHEFYDPIETTELSHSATVYELLEFARNHFGSDSVVLELDRDYLVKLICHTCQTEKSVGRPQNSVSMKQAICDDCGQVMAPETIHHIDFADLSTIGDRTLSEIGVPKYDILKIRTNDEYQFLLLAGDRSTFF